MITRNQINRCINRWRKKLRISPQFGITFALYDDRNNMPEDFRELEACIDVDLAYNRAKIEFNGPNLTEDNLDEVVLHELLHIILEPLAHFAELAVSEKYKDMVRVLNESAIENLIPSIIGDE